MRILMVCLGNICRSPLAEGILQQKIERSGLNWQVDSAGTGSWHKGEAPDPRSISVAQKNGIDISHQKARQFGKDDLQDFDLILTMDASNYKNVLELADYPSQKNKVQMIMNLVYPGSNISVPDPYWDDNGFDKVFLMLNQACEQLIEKHMPEEQY